MIIQAKGNDYRTINKEISESDEICNVKGCLGQRFIGVGTKDKKLIIDGISGNALGAYLNGSEIIVNGNAQDAVGDTMNDGKIIVNGNIGDAAGYSMRGGEIFVKGNAGYRIGIHLKEYDSKVPAIVIGGSTGSFLGEYQSGGIIIVLGISDKRIVGDFPCAGMHGGVMYLRDTGVDIPFPKHVSVNYANAAEIETIKKYVEEYCRYFGADVNSIMSSKFLTVRPDNSKNHKQMYVPN